MAQVPQSPTAGLTPNARSFHRYGEIPVSLYTGTPNITIPIDTINDGTLSLPIALSYHSGGIKADEHPGWVGLGWTLMLGGAITREVRDLPDEYDCNQKYGYMYTHDNLYKEQVWDANNSNVISSYISSIISNESLFIVSDTEPDKFSFNFDGYSGFFMMDTNGKWVINSNRPLKVKEITLSKLPQPGVVPITDGSSIINTIILIGDNGTEYIFGKDAIETSINLRTQKTSRWSVMAWYLTEIRHPNGDSLTFSYERGQYMARLTYSSSLEYIYNTNNGNYWTSGGESYDGMLISPIYLKEIKGNTFSINLHRSISNELNYPHNEYTRRLSMSNGNSEFPIYLTDGNTSMSLDEMPENIKWEKLDSIEIKSQKGTLYKKIRLRYNNIPEERLALKSVDITGKYDESEECYKFEYDRLSHLPQYLTQQTDHWGYYNGITNDNDIPETRNANARTATFGLLKKITYPTGGQTILNFESHTYSMIANGKHCGDLQSVDENLAGGVRISSIINIPNDSTIPEHHEFLYVLDYGSDNCDDKSSGILDGNPQYYDKWDLFNLEISRGGTESLAKLTSESGTHIGYSEVVELRGDGYSISYFTSHKDAEYKDISPIRSSDPDPFIRTTDLSYCRGKLKQYSIFNSKGHLLQQNEHIFEPLNGDMIYVPGLLATRETPGNISGFDRPKYSFYKNYIFNLVEKQSIERIYDNSKNAMFMRTHYKKYNNESQLVTDSVITLRYDNHNTEVSTYRYQWEQDNYFKSMHFMHQISEFSRLRNGLQIEKLSNEYSLVGMVPYLSKVTQIYPDTSERTLYKCLKANDKGLPVHIIDNSNTPITYLWGQDYLYPVCEIKGAKFEEVNTNLGFDASNSPNNSYQINNKVATLRNNLPSALVTSFSYKPHYGITSITDPSAKTTYFNYDAFGRLVNIRNNQNNKLNDFIYSSFAAVQNSFDYIEHVRNYYDSNLKLIGPHVSYPHCSFHYWGSVDLSDIGHRWEITGDTDSLSLSLIDDYVLITNNGTSHGYAELRLTILDERGSSLWHTTTDIIIEPIPYDITWTRTGGDNNSASIMLSICRKNNTKISTAYIYVNDKLNRIIDSGTDSQFSSMTGGVRGLIHIPRDYSTPFFQIRIDAGGIPTALEIPYDQLFPNETDSVLP